MRNRLGYLLLFAASVPVWRLAAQPVPAKPQPDVLVLSDDERLLGHLVKSSGATVTFHSDVLGDVTVDWSKIKELHTQGQFAVLPPKAQLRTHQNTSSIPQGNLQMTGQTITITPAGAAPQAVPVAQAGQVLEEATFQKEINPPPVGFTQAWTGAITGGGSLVEATQESETFTGAVSLVRAIPVETDFPPRNRTTFDFSGSEGHVIQRGLPEIKTEIAHADAERDEYFTASGVYAFGELALDHNFSQGLTLQQNYGGGIGWTVIRDPNETLDLKSSMDYMRQQFTVGPDHSLVGSNFGQDFLRKFGKGITFTEHLSVNPSWNELHAWIATGSAAVNFPVYKSLTFTLSVLESYLNNPPPAFRKNSFQATTGLTYTLK